MHFFGTKHFVYACIAGMIFSGLALAGTAVALTVMMPVFGVLIPILVPAVFTLSFLATGFLASGSFGASAIALLLWIYKKKAYSSYTLHVQEVGPEKAKKLQGGGKLPRGDKSAVKDKLVEINKLAEKLDKLAKVEEYKPLGKDQSSEINKPIEKDKSGEEDLLPRINKLMEELDEPLEKNKLAIAEEEKPMMEKLDEPPEENKLAITEEDKPLMEKLDEPPEKNKLETAEEDKPQGRDKSPEKEKLTEENTPVKDVKPAEEGTSILEISKVRSGEQKPTATKRFHQNRFAMDPNKARSIFMKECQKVPRVGAFAYKYFTSRDKKYVNHIHV